MMAGFFAKIYLVLCCHVWGQAPTPANKPQQIPSQEPATQPPVQPASQPSAQPSPAVPDLTPMNPVPPPMASPPMLPRRDPFRIPDYIILKVKQKAAESASVMRIGEIEDLNAPPIRRWSLLSYQLVGIIWDVKRPKAMFIDRQGHMHVLQLNDFIGNQKGVITDIQSGVVTVLEGKLQQLIKLKK